MADSSREKRARSAKSNVDVASFHARMTTLESHAFGPLPSASADNPVLHTSVPEERRSLVFSLADGSAKKVRVTLDHTEVVLFAGWSTPSKPRANGDWISVLIEVMGNPGDKAILNITNCNPASLTSGAIPPGYTQIADPHVVQASWK